MFFILGYGIFRNFGIWDIGIYFGIHVDMGYFGWFILGYGILPTPLTKPHFLRTILHILLNLFEILNKRYYCTNKARFACQITFLVF